MTKQRLGVTLAHWRWDRSRRSFFRIRNDYALLFHYRQLAQSGLSNIWRLALSRRRVRQAHEGTIQAWYIQTMSRRFRHWYDQAKDLARVNEELVHKRWKGVCRQSMVRALGLLRQHAQRQKAVRKAMGKRLIRLCIQSLIYWQTWNKRQKHVRRLVEEKRRQADLTLLKSCLSRWRDNQRLYKKAHQISQLVNRTRQKQCFYLFLSIKKSREMGRIVLYRRLRRIKQVYLQQWLSKARYSENMRYLKYHHAFRQWKIIMQKKKENKARLQQAMVFWVHGALRKGMARQIQQRKKGLRERRKVREVAEQMDHRRLCLALKAFCDQSAISLYYSKLERFADQWSEHYRMKQVLRQLKKDLMDRRYEVEQRGKAVHHHAGAHMAFVKSILQKWSMWAKEKRRCKELGDRLEKERKRSVLQGHLQRWRQVYQRQQALQSTQVRSVVYWEQSKMLISLTQFYRAVATRKANRHALAVGVNGRWTWMTSLFIKRCRTYGRQVARPAREARQKAMSWLEERRRQKVKKSRCVCASGWE